MNKTFCITTSNQVGATFLEWSIHFLSGQTQYCKFPEKKYIKLTDNPLSSGTNSFDKNNAHQHDKNHPIDFANAKASIDYFKTQSGLCSFYPIIGPIGQLAEEKNIDISNASQEVIWDLIELKSKEMFQIVEYCHQTDVKVIYIASESDLIFYHTISPRTSMFPLLSSKEYQLATIKQCRDEIDQQFFNQGQEKFDDYKNYIWDRREKLALDRRPWDQRSLTGSQLTHLNQPHMWVSCKEWVYNGPKKVKDILKFLDLPINTKRWDCWIPIYHMWQQTQTNLMNFDFIVEHLIKSIVNNWYYEFDELTFEQEVVIQHALIYRHGLNLKTWGLEKFPTNAQDLHKLLEPNFHQLSEY